MGAACRWPLWVFGGLFVSSVVWGQAQRGYTIQDGKVVVNTKEHWAGWQTVSKTVQVSDEGVKPAFLRKSTRIQIDGEEVVVSGINAVLDAGEFGGGVRNAGSGLSSAANLMDGRLDTFWGPETDDPLEDWWVQIDLGRAVSATRIVLRFVGEELGDPFLQFRVITSQGEQTTVPLIFRKVYQTDRPIKDERVFEIDLTRQSPSKFPEVRGDFTGDVIRYVGVSVTDSDYGRARQVTQADYERLEPGARGDIQYFRKEASGRQRLLEGQDDWVALKPDKRGDIVYYRRELPRLAEVEVWSIGDNVGLGVLARGGSVTSIENNGAESAVVDGDVFSVVKSPFWPAQGGYNPDKLLPSEPLDVERELVIDLGGSFFLDNIRVIQSTSLPPGAFPAYRLRLSDGSTNAGGGLAWKTVASLQDIPYNSIYHDFQFPLSRVAFFSFTYRLFFGAGSGRHGLSEIQFFGEGYMPEVQIASVFKGASAFIDLGNNAQNLATLEWDADLPAGTDLILQTKTGDTVRNVTHYYKKNGQEYTGTEEEAKKAYEANKKAFGEASVGPVVTESVPGSDWSGWSQRYFRSGDRITSPSPRKWVALQATLLTENPLVAATLRSVTIHFVTPVAKALVGEVLPPRLGEVGVGQQLSYFLRSSFDANSRGFDEILIEAPVGVDMTLSQVSVEISGQGRQTYTAGSEGFAVISEGSDSLWLHLPAPIRTIGGTASMELQFATTVFGATTYFNGSVRNSAFSDSWQRVDDGDANGIVDSETTVVVALEGKDVLGGIGVDSEVFTPNGDGINDELRARFSLMRVGAAVPLQVQVYDLSGRLVRVLRDDAVFTGRHEVIWTGIDEQGAAVPPGTYLLRIGLDLDSPSKRDTVAHRLVHVAY